MLRLVVPLLCCLLPFVIQVNGQNSTTLSPGEAGAAKPRAYDVVSIRQVKGEPVSGGYGDVADGFSMRGLTLKSLIPDAYGVRGDAVSGWPKWADSMRFDIDAKMDPETAGAFDKLSREQQKVQRQLMLQSLLVDRFMLKVHSTTEERTAYELILAKSGLKMKENNTGLDMDGNPWRDGIRPATDWMISEGKISGHGMPVSILAGHLEGAVDSIVADKTGLKGRYDVLLQWDPSQKPDSDSTEPSIFAALEQQLGLRLKPTKTTVDMITIDHLEMPSAN
jgi:uncharacterized protein (TIGR03435 family)